MLKYKKNGHMIHRESEALAEMMLIENKDWLSLSYEEKNHQLYLRQKDLLDGFLARGAISQAQHDRSLRDLTEKMGEK